jgi:O-antigen/teichoic acid export membrane protein
MIKNVVHTFKSNVEEKFFSHGDARSINAKKNIAFSFVIKGLNILIGFALVPLTIKYATSSQYGIWLTLSSIIAWFGFFDIGFGNGLRNKFAEAVAKNQHGLAQIYVSTTYAILSIIITLVLLLFFCVNPLLNWSHILNTSDTLDSELSILARVVFVFFCMQFVLQLITIVLTANQEPAKAVLFNFFGNCLALVSIFVLTKVSAPNLLYLTICMGLSPIVVLFGASWFFYSKNYKRYAPKFKFVQLKYAKNLMSLGLKFFIIQIGALIIFQTDNIIISQILGNEEVTRFNVAYKLFSAINMVFFIIITPLWSAFTDAYNKNDLAWIKNVLRKLQKYWLILVLVASILFLISPWLYFFWLGNSVNISRSISLAMTVNVIALSWQSIHVYLLNGIGKIKLQVYLVILSAVFNIPLSIFLGKEFGLPGIIFANTIVFVFMGIVFSIQCKMILNNTAKNIWIK